MNLIYSETGGRPRKVDDQLLLQDEAYKALNATLKHLNDARGAFILTGCVPSGITRTIEPGMIYMNGEFLEFAGATNVTFPVTIGVEEELTTFAQYEDGGNKATRKNRFASISDDADKTGGLTITPDSYQELNDLLVKQYGNQQIDGNKNFRENLLARGLNVYDQLIKLASDIAGVVTNVNNILAATVTDLTNQVNAALATKANVTPLVWNNLTLNNGWTQVASEEVQYSKDQFGTVRLRGTASTSSYSSNQTIAILPDGFRPNAGRFIQQVVWCSGNQFGAVSIGSTGFIEGYNSLRNQQVERFTLNGISFSAD